ncbi:MAG: glycosyltransferase family 4 protein [Candidatus Acidiferrales bacterium]
MAMTREVEATSDTISASPSEIAIALLTGCQDRPYAFGLAMALASRGISLDVIGSDEVDSPEMHSTAKLHFLNLRGNQRQDTNSAKRLSKLLIYYVRLIRYAASAEPKIFHILWNNRFEYIDRTLVMLYYKTLGKKIVLTVHNVNQARRDAKDSMLNRLTLRIQYRLADHIFVHTEAMKKELLEEFQVRGGAVTVIPFGINNAVPHTDLTTVAAKRQLGVKDGEKAILFFGRLRPYKGLEHLLAAYQQLTTRRADYRLIIAGEPKKGSEEYLDEILQTIRGMDRQERMISRFQFIPDRDTELYFKAADVLVLPYKEIFHSGVLFLAHSFGLPVVAADVGPFREEIVEGRTGFLCNPSDASDLANAIERYFASDLYRNLENRRDDIRDHASERHSWSVVGEMTQNVYTELLGNSRQ